MQRAGIGDALAMASFGLAVGCSHPDAFQCEADGQCDHGLCVEGGFCGFPDADCPSGLRYGQHAGNGLSGACVPMSGTDTQFDNATTNAAAESGSTATNGSTTLALEGDSSDSSDANVPCQTWWDLGWTRRRALTVNAGRMRQPVANFPASLRLDVDLPTGSGSADGSDLRFVGADCQVLPHELELSAGGALAVAWIQLPEVSATASPVHVYYGNPDPDPDPAIPSVWDEGFVGVWHLADFRDATESEHDLLGPLPMSIDGPLGAALFFDGVDDLAQTPASPTLAFTTAPGISVSAWVRVDVPPPFGSMRIIDKADGLDATLGFVLTARLLATGLIEFEFDRGRALGERSLRAVASPVELGTWHHVAVIDDGDPSSVFVVDGVASDATVDLPGDGDPLPDDDTPLTFGAAPYVAQRHLQGAIDEVRLSAAVRSSDWMVAEYLASTGTLLAVGPEESAPGG